MRKTDLVIGAYGYSTSTGRVYVITSEVAPVISNPDRLRGSFTFRGAIKFK